MEEEVTTDYSAVQEEKTFMYTGHGDPLGDGVAEEITKPEEPIDFLQHYVKPHDKRSREVMEEDIERVIKDAHIMYNLCYTKVGMYSGGYAVAHPQIDDKDPLRFFVTVGKEVVINPVIVRHTKFSSPKLEGCMTFPDRERIEVPRFYKITAEYQELMEDGKLSGVKIMELKGTDAEVWQHECAHLEPWGYIYPKD